jgi:hypothetical protein
VDEQFFLVAKIDPGSVGGLVAEIILALVILDYRMNA